MTWLRAFNCTVSKCLSPLTVHHPRWLRLALAAAAIPAMLLFCGHPASAGGLHCPRGEHESSGHCCPKDSDWSFFGCAKNDNQQAAQEQDCMAGQERLGNGCVPKSCPIGEELRGFDCQPISCGMNETLVGNACVTSMTCPMGQAGTPPFCH